MAKPLTDHLNWRPICVIKRAWIYTNYYEIILPASFFLKLQLKLNPVREWTALICIHDLVGISVPKKRLFEKRGQWEINVWIPSPSFCFAWGVLWIKYMQFLQVKTGKERTMVITRFGTPVPSYVNVQPLHLTPLCFALLKGLSGVRGERNLDCLFHNSSTFFVRKRYPRC